tara:strand:- start:146 stop:388 length:243 start_codon:yes stop_codon:yes gene_type:complete
MSYELEYEYDDEVNFCNYLIKTYKKLHWAAEHYDMREEIGGIHDSIEDTISDVLIDVPETVQSHIWANFEDAKDKINADN